MMTTTSARMGTTNQLASGPAEPPESHVGPCSSVTRMESRAATPLSGAPNTKVSVKSQAPCQPHANQRLPLRQKL